MRRVFSNGKNDYVANAFDRLSRTARTLYLAAPYFSYANPVIDAARAGKTVRLLIGLNSATKPNSVAQAVATPRVDVRYLTKRFHAKIYIFDGGVLLGSSNLSDNGLYSNREAVICLDRSEDQDAVAEVRELFAELWEAAAVVTPEKLEAFQTAWRETQPKLPDRDDEIARIVGEIVAPNIDVGSRNKSREQIFIEGLQRRVYEQYRPAFAEVDQLLEEGRYRRSDLLKLGPAHETNRFLNWLRLEHAVGDSWRDAAIRSEPERRELIRSFAETWLTTDITHVPEDYLRRLDTIRRSLPDEMTLRGLTQEEVTAVLLSVHAFSDQFRFVSGGSSALGPAFWRENNNDVARVTGSLARLLFGKGDFVERLHDQLYDPRWKLRKFGIFCALELFGTVRPELYPPINGRMAKSLKFLGFDVEGT